MYGKNARNTRLSKQSASAELAIFHWGYADDAYEDDVTAILDKFSEAASRARREDRAFITNGGDDWHVGLLMAEVDYEG